MCGEFVTVVAPRETSARLLKLTPEI